MYSWISITIWTSDVKVCRDAELIFCNVEKDRVIVSFTYTFASKYTKTHVINWFLFFAYSTLTQTIFSVCQSHLHFWNSVSFIQQSVCELKHETNLVYVTKNRDLSISLISYNSTSQSLFDNQKYLKEAFELSKRDKYNLQLPKMWPCPINL